MMKSSTPQYILIIAIYVAVWIAGFSRLHDDPFLVIGCLAAAGYGSGQIIELMLRQHIGLSADPIALPGAALMTAAGTWWCVTQGQLHPAAGLYLEIGGRFLVAFFLGHSVLMLSAGLIEAITRVFRKRSMP